MHAAGVERIPRPAVPTNLEVSLDYKLFLKVHAVGTQNYICAPAATATGVDWLFIGPQATLFNDSLQQTGTHYQSRNPQRNNAIQATWQDSGDTSAVWATRRDGSLDANYVAPGAIEWLLLDVSGAQLGPTAGNKLTPSLLIQRVNTVGGSQAAVDRVHAGNAEHAQAGVLRGRLLLLQITPSPSVRQTDSSITASHAAGHHQRSQETPAAQPRAPAACEHMRSGTMHVHRFVKTATLILGVVALFGGWLRASCRRAHSHAERAREGRPARVSAVAVTSAHLDSDCSASIASMRRIGSAANSAEVRPAPNSTAETSDKGPTAAGST